MAAGTCAVSALDDIVKILSFPLLGVDSYNGSEFINHELLTLTTSKATARRSSVQTTSTRASAHESTKPAKRAS